MFLKLKQIIGYRKKSILKVWIIHYIITLLLPLGSSVYIYNHLSNIIQNEISHSSEISIDFMAQSLGEKFNNIEKFYEDIYNSDSTARIVQEMNEKGDIDMYTASSYIRKFTEKREFHENINCFILYFEDCGKIISSSGYYDDRDFFELYFNNYDGSFESWRNEFFCNGTPFFRIGDPLSPQIYHSASIYYPNTRKSNVKLLTEINEEAVLNDINKLQETNDEIYFITDNDGGLLWQIGGVEGNYEKIYPWRKEVKINGNDYIADKAEFKYWGMTIYHLVGEKKVYTSVVFAHRLFFVIMFLSMVLGVALIFIFTRNDYHELLTIFDVLDYKPKEGELNERDEMEIIRREITSQKKQNEEYRTMLTEQRRKMADYTVKKVLKGTGENSDTLFTALNLTPVSEYFSTAIISMSDKAIADIIVGMIHDSLRESGYRVFCVDYDGYKTFLINCTSGNINRIQEDFGYALIYSKENFGTGFCAVLSNACETVRFISTEYQRLRETIKEREASGEEGVFTETFDSAVNDECYYYPAQEERQLLSAVNAGDAAKTKEILEGIYSNNFIKKRIDIDMAYCLFNNMLGTLMNVINNYGLSDKSNKLIIVSIVRSLNESKTIGEMQQLINETAKLCCEGIKEKLEHRNNSQIDEIVSYVDGHYSDYNLNVSSVAEKFNMSSTAMSKIFKKEVDMGMLEYINLLRLNQACRLLENTDKPISDIAKSVGCGNYRTFARLFIKQYGITAKQYREINR